MGSVAAIAGILGGLGSAAGGVSQAVKAAQPPPAQIAGGGSPGGMSHGITQATQGIGQIVSHLQQLSQQQKGQLHPNTPQIPQAVHPAQPAPAGVLPTAIPTGYAAPMGVQAALSGLGTYV